MIKSPVLSRLAISPSLRKYFRSGWAFLIPYLAAYLLYWWLRWPVNPLPRHSLGDGGRIPSLLHLYWALHAINLALAAIALVAWWRERHIGSVSRNPATTLSSAEDRRAPDLGPSTLDLMARLAPWLLLALLFYIPSVYLEFPADPWEHYARINEWFRYERIDQNPVWMKTSSFLAYSLLSRATPPARQLFWFDFYYTGCCLLLCWQYYRLARAVGLSERASFIFVLVQTFTFGNNIFGFYRYYGMSSTVFSQLGAMALIRIAIEVAKGPLALRFKLKALSAALCAACLLALTAFNHIQGVGIAALGLGAVIVWRLIAWRRSMIFWLAAVALALSVAAILWWPRNSALDEVYRFRGWLTAWYGFNLFSPSSPAFERSLQILGAFGVVNFLASLILLRRNHVIAWLTIMPLFGLCMPFVAIPLTNAFAHRSVPEILAFHRMLLAIPVGLAVVGLTIAVTSATEAKTQSLEVRTSILRKAIEFRALTFVIVMIALLALTIMPVNGPYYNRLYNALMRPASDLAMTHVIAALPMPGKTPSSLHVSPRIIGTLGVIYVAYAVSIDDATRAVRLINNIYPTISTPAQRLAFALASLPGTNAKKEQALLFVPSATRLSTPVSLSGFLSHHWLPQEVALEHATGPEEAAAARNLGGKEIKAAAGTYFSFGGARLP